MVTAERSETHKPRNTSILIIPDERFSFPELRWIACTCGEVIAGLRTSDNIVYVPDSMVWRNARRGSCEPGNGRWPDLTDEYINEM